jgi:hypothetical protein
MLSNAITQTFIHIMYAQVGMPWYVALVTSDMHTHILARTSGQPVDFLLA